MSRETDQDNSYAPHSESVPPPGNPMISPNVIIFKELTDYPHPSTLA